MATRSRLILATFMLTRTTPITEQQRQHDDDDDDDTE
jgi:hypothetical protein